MAEILGPIHVIIAVPRSANLQKIQEIIMKPPNKVPTMFSALWYILYTVLARYFRSLLAYKAMEYSGTSDNRHSEKQSIYIERTNCLPPPLPH